MACSKVCDKCGLMAENFKSVREFKKHFQKHGDPVSCPQCEKLFPTRIRMQAHVIRYHKESRVTCEECSKSFSSKDSLTQHSKYHTAPFGVSCRRCKKTFSSTTTGNFLLIS